MIPTTYAHAAAILAGILILTLGLPPAPREQALAQNSPAEPAVANTGPPQGAVRGQHGEWQIVCRPPPPGSKAEVCAMSQGATDIRDENLGIQIYFQKFATGEFVFRVFTSLGVYLPRGIELRVDDESLWTIAFIRCLPVGCMTQHVLSEAETKKLLSGKTGILIFFRTPEKGGGVGVPIDLSGFADAYAALN